MTRLDYINFAAALASQKPEANEKDRALYALWAAICNAIADAFGMRNPTFDRKRFLKDCGVRKE